VKNCVSSCSRRRIHMNIQASLLSYIQHNDVESFRQCYLQPDAKTSHVVGMNGIVEYYCILEAIECKRVAFVKLVYELCNRSVTKLTLRSLAYCRALLSACVLHDEVDAFRFLVDHVGLMFTRSVVERTLELGRFSFLVVLMQTYEIHNDFAMVQYLDDNVFMLLRRVQHKSSDEQVYNCLYFMLKFYPTLCFHCSFISDILALNNSTLTTLAYTQVCKLKDVSLRCVSRLLDHAIRCKSLKNLRFVCQSIAPTDMLSHIRMLLSSSWVQGFHYLYSWLYTELPSNEHVRLFRECWNPEGEFVMQECCIALMLSSVCSSVNHPLRPYLHNVATMLERNLTFESTCTSFFYPQYKLFFIAEHSRRLCNWYPELLSIRNNFHERQRNLRSSLSQHNLLPECIINLVDVLI
jgi:hypothetical protein